MNRILAVNLRDQRLRAEMSQETLARILRVSPSVIAAWEDGTAEPDREQLVRISQALGIRIEDLTGEGTDNGSADTMPPPPHCTTADPGYVPRAASSEGASPLNGMLEPGETVLWEGKPVYRRPRSSGYVIFFGIFWLSFAIVWTVVVGSMAGAFALFGFPFITVGIWILFGTGYSARHAFAGTYYMITERRILLYGGFGRPVIAQIMLADVRSVDTVIVDNEVATLVPITAYTSASAGASPYMGNPYRISRRPYVPGRLSPAYLTSALVNIRDYTQVRNLIMSHMGDGKTT